MELIAKRIVTVVARKNIVAPTASFHRKPIILFASAQGSSQTKRSYTTGHKNDARSDTSDMIDSVNSTPPTGNIINNDESPIVTRSDVVNLDEKGKTSARVKFNVHIDKPLPRDELNSLLGKLPKIDFSKNDDFLGLLEQSNFAKFGNSLKKMISVEGIIKSKDDNGLMVDFGSKFDARLYVRKVGERDLLKLKPNEQALRQLQLGDRVVIDIKDLERTEHLQGDSKPVTIHRAIARYNHKATYALLHQN